MRRFATLPAALVSLALACAGSHEAARSSQPAPNGATSADPARPDAVKSPESAKAAAAGQPSDSAAAAASASAAESAGRQPEAGSRKPEEEPTPGTRLPLGVHPTHYTLALEIVPERPRFSGTAEIELQLDEPRPFLWLNGKELHVTSAQVESAATGTQEAKYQEASPEGVAKVSFARPLPAGPAKLRIAWDAAFNEHLEGVYLARAGGKAYASTQMEAIAARNAFPCWDDPVFKTPYDVAITGPAADEIVANTRAIEEKPAGEGMKTLRFATSLPLPTYLILWAVGPFEKIEVTVPPNAVRTRPLQMRFFAPQGRGKDLAYAVKSAPPLLERLEEYFNLEYPYDKLDHLALPDFQQGAMENAGAITYRETFLLFDPEKSSEEAKFTIADGLAHEMAHQWFGDSVTLRWWDDAWLNEAFATWLADRILDKWDPTLESSLDLLRRMHGAMGSDSLVSARKIRQPIENNLDIERAFDLITYQKGASVLGMFETYAGADAFREGVRAYVRSHANGGGSTDELLAAFSKAAGKDLATPFHTFLEQEGVPLLTAKVSCGKQGAKLELGQSRYLPLGSAGDRARIWQLPVCARYQMGKETKSACTLLTSAQGALALPGKGCPDWVLPNDAGAGYYRWSLAPADLRKLRSAGYPKLTTRERVSFANALRASVSSGSLPVADALEALQPLALDPSSQVSQEAAALLGITIERFAGDDLRARAQAYGAELYRPVLKKLGWDAKPGEPLTDTRLRELVINFMVVTAEDPAALQEAARRGRKLANLGGTSFDASAVQADLQATVLGAAVQQGDAALFDALDLRLGKVEDAPTRSRIISALARTKDPTLGERALQLAFDPRLRKNERFGTLLGRSARLESREAAYRWALGHYDQLAALLGDRAPLFMPGLGAGFCDQKHLDELEQFFAPKLAAQPQMRRSLATNVERMKLCIALVDAQGPSARGFLKKLALGRTVPSVR